MAIQIIPLSEGAFTIDATKEFVPFDLEHDVLNQRPTGSLLVEIQPFLLKSGNTSILLDTGLGYRLPDGELQIHQNLLHHGVNPDEVNHVLLSHLHKDHSGGLGYKSNGIKQATFPDAVHYIYRKEWDFALEKGLPSYDPQDFLFLPEAAAIEWLMKEEDEFQIGPFHIHYKWVGAHCPYHIAYWITDNERKQVIFFGGDVAPQLGQMKRKIIAKYDYDGRKSMEWREKWWNAGTKEHWAFLFYHDIKNAVYTP